ncbi:MAG TPA: CcmD family protein [Polyangiaceae bacterium]|nr:CcmD family protein [Polyangiaceae bacterium]
MSASQAAPDDRSTEFVAVRGGGEETSASSLLVSAYVVMWALLLGFLFLSWRKQQRIEARLTELDRAISRSRPADPRP